MTWRDLEPVSNFHETAWIRLAARFAAKGQILTANEILNELDLEAWSNTRWDKHLANLEIMVAALGDDPNGWYQLTHEQVEAIKDALAFVSDGAWSERDYVIMRLSESIEHALAEPHQVVMPQ